MAVLGPNGAGKTTFVRAVATLLRLDRGTLRVLGHDVRREPDRGAAADRPRRPVRGRRAGDDRTREPGDGRPPLRPGPAHGTRERRSGCSSSSTSSSRRPARAHLLGRHAPPARPRRQPGRAAAAAAPRRADDRPRPAQPDRALGRDPDARRGRHRRAAHHAVPRRGRPARRPDRDHRPRPGDRRAGRRPSSSGRSAAT